MIKNFKYWSCLALSIFILPSCSNTASLSGRTDLARNISISSGFHEKQIKTKQFTLTSYQRIDNSGLKAARIYIEGDGQAWLSRTTPSLNPTPTDPIALRLAAKDPAPNIIYLARPCQYSAQTDKTPCDQKYWMSSRFAAEVINTYQSALYQLSKSYNLQSFELVGYSGGAAIAAILAGTRKDITSLRTVAGNLDHRAHSRHHNVSMLNGSLNPPDYAQNLSRIPQYHFIGKNDDIVPPSIYQSYAESFSNTLCLNNKILPKQNHF